MARSYKLAWTPESGAFALNGETLPQLLQRLTREFLQSPPDSRRAELDASTERVVGVENKCVFAGDPRELSTDTTTAGRSRNRRPLDDTNGHRRVDEAFDPKTPAFIQKIHRVEDGHERTKGTSASESIDCAS